jgi:hypothetical protein
MKRRSRFTSIAGMVAMVMAILAVCPCPAMAALPADGHDCCAGKAGLNAAPDPGSCCANDARDTVADAPPGVTLAGGWQAAPMVIVAAPVLLLPLHAAAAPSPPAAPHILRV